MFVVSLRLPTTWAKKSKGPPISDPLSVFTSSVFEKLIPFVRKIGNRHQHWTILFICPTRHVPTYNILSTGEILTHIHWSGQVDEMSTKLCRPTLLNRINEVIFSPGNCDAPGRLYGRTQAMLIPYEVNEMGSPIPVNPDCQWHWHTSLHLRTHDIYMIWDGAGMAGGGWLNGLGM